jgi:Tol biopolymer transport system component
VIDTGKRLGPYEIVAPLGAGGMGEVYRARDIRLGRDVAVKVLPSHLSENPELKQRFEREAKAISQLTHPHICTLYDVGSQDGVEYLVMELLEGETLADRLGKGALPRDLVIRCGIEITEALEKAHRAGIIHRDLKPGNIMLTKSGVKLLDFGLAKMVAGPVLPAEASGLPTQGVPSQPLTEQGTVMGTFQYMAPEQIEGAEADARTDIFALGTVLYEMATGRKAFMGKSRVSLIGSILKDEPPAITSIEPMTPPALDRLVQTCLAKEPDERFQTAHDVKLQLRWIAEGGSQAGLPSPMVARRKNREKLALGVAAAALLVAGFATYGYLRRAPSEVSRIRSFLLPEEKSEFDLTGANCGSLTVSPDGRRVTFATKGADGKMVLWLRSLGDLAAKPIPGTQGATFPFWSSDSRFLAFFADGKLQKVDISGAPPLTVCDAPNGRSGAWNREGVILFSPDATTGLMRVPAAGGPPKPATTLDAARGETTHRWATFLPDGRHYLYLSGSHVAATKAEVNALYIGALDSNEKTLLLQARSNVVYASGYLLYVRERILLAQRFDPGSRRLVGEAIPVSEGVQYDPMFFRGGFSASQNGVLVYATGAASPNTRLYWHDRSGKRLGDPIGWPAEYRRFRIASDGKRLAGQIDDPGTGTGDIWIFDSRGVRTRFTFGTPAWNPVWSPDGGRIAYAKSEKQARTGVYVKPASGGGGEEALYHNPTGFVAPTDWSPDGRFLALTVATGFGKTKTDVWILPLTGDHKAYAFLATEFNEDGNSFSPDGRWFLYTSDESGRRELYVVPFPGPGGKWQVSTGGAVGGSWVKGGKEIIYLSGEINFVSVEVNTGESGIEIGSPKVLFNGGNWSWGAITTDGERILGAERPEAEEKPRVALVTNRTAPLAPK